MKRIQRKRTKGWRMPGNTVYVGRPTEWGNPFKLTPDGWILFYSTARHILDPWILWSATGGFNQKDIVELYELWITKDSYTLASSTLPTVPDIEELRGKDLACWCILDQPCHADVLIKLLNNETTQ